MLNKMFFLLLAALFMALVFSACEGGLEYLSGQYRTVVAPPAKTAAAQGGRIAQTQGAKLLQTAQIKLATESANLKETAKVEAATAAAGVIDTVQAKLVTQSAGQVTAGPTQMSNLRQTAEDLLLTQAAIRLPQVETQAAIIRGTTEARLSEEAAQRFPLTLTQAAAFQQTVQAGIIQSTLVPPAPGSGAAELAMTAQAALATQFALLQATPPPPAQQTGSTIVVYRVREGDVLSSIASRFGIPVENLISLNQLRFPWLAGLPQNLQPGMALIVAVIPENSQAPVIPFGQPAWSNIPGCDVSQVDWLSSPIDCRYATIDFVSKIEMTVGCVSLKNPLGYTLTHEVVTGWMLSGADNTASYGWFTDLDRRVVIVGPAVVSGTGAYTECRAPSK